VLDPYDISVIRHGGGRPRLEFDNSGLDSAGLAMCQAHNPNDITKENFAQGIEPGPASRWVPFNGALGEAQVCWLRETLQEAHDEGEQVVLLSHVVLHPDATPNGNGLTLLWNYEEVLEVIRAAPTPPSAVFCGHAHLPVHYVDQITGTHHVTFASPLEVEPGHNSFALVDVLANGDLIVRFPSGGHCTESDVRILSRPGCLQSS